MTLNGILVPGKGYNPQLGPVACRYGHLVLSTPSPALCDVDVGETDQISMTAAPQRCQRSMAPRTDPEYMPILDGHVTRHVEHNGLGLRQGKC